VPQPLPLTCHPATPCALLEGIAAACRREPGPRLVISFSLSGEIERLRLPPRAAGQRADGLWRHSCFEAFVRDAGADVYHEFNVAPSGDWAAYRFDRYRQGMGAANCAPPVIVTRAGARRLEVHVTLDLADMTELTGNAPWAVALAAVIEADDGALSYWALAHPPGRPDFHHAAGFTCTLSSESRA
jgi:hypothetical protein